MIYPYIVNKDGKWYPSGADVPEVSSCEKDFSNYMNPPSDTKINNYTKTDIKRMPIAELQALAAENGFDGAYSMTGADLKKILIEHFGL